MRYFSKGHAPQEFSPPTPMCSPSRKRLVYFDFFRLKLWR